MQQGMLLENLALYAITQPEKIAVNVLNASDINVIDAKITFHELFTSVYNLAQIIKKQSSIGDRVLLCYPTGLDFIIAFYACLWAKVIAVAVVVPSNEGLIKKFNAIAANSTPTLLLTDSKTFDGCIHKQVGCEAFNRLVTDALELTAPVSIDGLMYPDIQLSEIAFLQYTSGSTAAPKGVMISHGNLIANINDMTEAFNGTSDSIGLNWLPHTHDMGLIGSFLHSVHKGAVIYLMSPTSFIRRPLMWLQALSRYRVEITGAPCFALQLCIEMLSDEKIKSLDLQSLRYIIIGSEPISNEVVNKFYDKLMPAGLSKQALAPSYGLAEATLMVSSQKGLNTLTLDYKALSRNVVKIANTACLHTITLLSCGRPYLAAQIVSFENHLPCSDNTVGEIWLQGAAIAKGYWQNALETQHHFKAMLNGAEDELYFRTGDLGFLHQGELYVVGRLKEVIIINGLNYYPEDIEHAALLCDGNLHRATCVAFQWRAKDAVTDGFVVLLNTRKRLSDELYAMLTIKIKKQLLKEFQLVPHDVQFTNMTLPKTTSGKLQRMACKQLYIEQCEPLYVE